MGIDISTLQCQEISTKVSVNVLLIFLRKYLYRYRRYFRQKVLVSISAITFESIVNNTLTTAIVVEGRNVEPEFRVVLV